MQSLLLLLQEHQTKPGPKSALQRVVIISIKNTYYCTSTFKTSTRNLKRRNIHSKIDQWNQKFVFKKTNKYDKLMTRLTKMYKKLSASPVSRMRQEN